MQSLALDVNVVSEEGQRTEIRDEDDDLLRAAEELGIDLSGVRALAGDAADEAVEGEETPRAEGAEDSEQEEEGSAEGPADDDLIGEDGLELDGLEGLDEGNLAET
jgi:DNA-directed RNA polymerase subunit beta